LKLSLPDMAKKYARQFKAGRKWGTLSAYAAEDFTAGYEAALAASGTEPTRERVSREIATALGYDYVMDQPMPAQALWPDKHDFLEAADAVMALYDNPADASG
jgi:hypothetical protein